MILALVKLLILSLIKLLLSKYLNYVIYVRILLPFEHDHSLWNQNVTFSFCYVFWILVCILFSLVQFRYLTTWIWFLVRIRKGKRCIVARTLSTRHLLTETRVVSTGAKVNFIFRPLISVFRRRDGVGKNYEKTNKECRKNIHDSD